MPRPRTVHAFADDALAADDAVALRDRLQRGEVSAAELVEAAIARAERVAPELGAVAYQAYDRARVGARAPRAGWFSGVPTFVKDNADVAGMPTQHGSRAWTAHPAKADGGFARMYQALGPVVLGKTQLSEFGFSASAEYPVDWGWAPVRNPWELDHTSGASSAGSAALVAAGVVPLAHANDGGGSIRIPAACCGLVGLKPTRGRTPGDARSQGMPVRLVADGVVTRSVRDTAVFLREAEKVYRDLSLPPIGDIRGPSRKRLRIGVVTESVGGRVVDPACVSAVDGLALELERAGHHVEASVPPVPATFADDFAMYWGLLAAWLLDTGRVTLDRHFERSRTDNLSRGLARTAHRNLRHLPGVVRRLQGSGRLSREFFAQHGYDVVLCPTLAHPTPRLGVLDPGQPFETVFENLLDWVAFTPLQNATGDPAVSLPVAQVDGLPLGVMAAAPRGGEATLLALAYEVEQMRPFARLQD